MTEKIKVSVLMSVYNEELSMLTKATESIINQTYSFFEFIIVNDNPENYASIDYLNKLAVQDSRVKVMFNEKNIGITQSLNRGIKEATGEYVLRMDADDIAYPERIEKQLEIICERKADILGTYVDYIDADDKFIAEGLKQPCNYKDIEKIIEYKNCLYHPTWLVKKSVYEELDGYREVLACEDYDFLLRANKAGYRIENSNLCLLHYRINEKSISHRKKLEQMVITDYLQKRVKQLEEITDKDIKVYLDSIYSNAKLVERFYNAEYYDSYAIMLKRKKCKAGMLLYMFRAMCICSFYRNKYIRIVKSKFL